MPTPKEKVKVPQYKGLIPHVELLGSQLLKLLRWKQLQDQKEKDGLTHTPLHTSNPAPPEKVNNSGSSVN